MTQILLKTVKLACKFKQILSPGSFVPMFRYQNLKYSSERKLFQNLISSHVERNEKYCKSSANEEEKEDTTQPLVKLTIITKDGKEVPIEARVGMTVMKAITKHEDLEMEAACGGELACTTCHVYYAEKDEYFTPICDTEQDLLDAVPCATRYSRLCCQMKILKEFENVRIQMPNDTTNYFIEGSGKL